MTFRATALAALTTAPVPQAAQTALTQGMATAAGFGALVGPSLNLAAFAGTGSAAVVTPAVFPLVGSAAGLALAALLVLAVQAVSTYHRGSARALRISDEGGPGT